MTIGEIDTIAHQFIEDRFVRDDHRPHTVFLTEDIDVLETQK